MVFEEEMPQIKIDLYQFKNPSEITINLRYLSFGRLAYRMGAIMQRDLIGDILAEVYPEDVQDQKMTLKIQRFGSEVTKLAESKLIIAGLKRELSLRDEKIASLSIQHNRLTHSLTWITGKIITYPFRIFYDILSKKN